MSARLALLLRALGALVLVALLVQLHACSMKHDEKAAHTTSPTKQRETDPRALFRIGDDIVTGPDAHPLRARFAADGAELARATDGARVRMRVRSVGRAGAMHEIALQTKPALEGERVSYARTGLTEWYEPKLDGLEQGAVVSVRPAGSGALRVDVEVDPPSEVVASKSEGALDILRDGVPLFRYGKLSVVDAKGANLAAKLERRGASRIGISIDDANASYPITIDPLIWALQTKLVSLVPEPDDAFGADVAISGDNILVGLVGRHAFDGAAAFFRRAGTSWTHEKLLEYANVPHGRNLGAYVAIDGDEAVVGSENAATVMKRVNGTWTVEQIIQAPILVGNGFFGVPVAKKGNILALSVRQHDAAILSDGGVIAGGSDGGPPSEGAIFVYERSGSTWTLRATIPFPYLLNRFYARLALDGDTLVAGLGYHVVVFRRAADATWSVEAFFPKLHPTEFIGVLGQDVGLVGDVMVATDYPLIEVFQRKNGQWAPTQTIVPTNIGGSQFGTAVCLTSTNVFVGDPALDGTGAVFRYRLVNGLFALEEQFSPPTTTSSLLGVSLDATNDTAVFAAPSEGAGSGAVYVYGLASSLGEACGKDDACASGHCVDGVCCDTACGGGSSADCLRCDGALTRGTCAPAAAGIVCRDSTNECDIDERCDGVLETCPADSARPNGSTCSAGQCVAGECRAAPSGPAVTSDASNNAAAPSEDPGGCSASTRKTGGATAAASIVGVLMMSILRRRRARRARTHIAPFLLAIACLLLCERAPRSFELGCPSQRVSVLLSREGASWIDDETGFVATSSLDRFGRASAMKIVEDVEPSSEQNRVVFRRGPLVEWYESQSRGIEQGFDVTERPSGEGPLLLGLRGDVGRTHLSYGELHAFDARGRVLVARLERDETRITLEIDDRDAVYPITIDPLVWKERQRVEASPPKKGSSFGGAIATRDDLLVVGSPRSSDAVVVFERAGVSYAPVAKLSPIELLQFNGQYGLALAIDGERIVVGAHFDNGFAGRAYLFERSQGVWKQTMTFYPDDDVVGRQLFGRAVALSGDTLVIGAPDEDINGPFGGPGAAYVFRYVNGSWTREAKLRAPPPVLQFGAHLSLEKDTLIVTASLCQGGVDFHGDNVFFFERSGTSWTPELVVGDAARARYGCTTALQGDTAFVSGPFPTVGTPTPTAFVDVYTRADGVWSKRTRLRPSDPFPNSAFGLGLAFRGNRLAIAAPGKDKGRGAAYLFEGAGDTWNEKQRFVASDGQIDDHFGNSIALSKDMLLVGAPERDKATGAVYTYFQGLQGDPCTSGDVCASGFCIDGVCCDSECGAGNDFDCQACSAAKGAPKDGVCGPAKGNVCRAARDECDVAESCDGEHVACPADVTATNGTTCNAGAGQCGGGRCLSLTSVSTIDAGPVGAPAPEEGGCAMARTSSSVWLTPILALAALAFLRRLTKPRRRTFGRRRALVASPPRK